MNVVEGIEIEYGILIEEDTEIPNEDIELLLSSEKLIPTCNGLLCIGLSEFTHTTKYTNVLVFIVKDKKAEIYTSKPPIITVETDHHHYIVIPLENYVEYIYAFIKLSAITYLRCIVITKYKDIEVTTINEIFTDDLMKIISNF